MTALRLAFRAYKDFYDQIWWLLLVVAIWWILTVTIVFGPPATLLLFHEADPRQGAWQDRLGLRGFGRYLLDNFVRGWKLFLAIVPLVALLLFNLDYYGGTDNSLAALAIIWLVLAILCITTGVMTMAIAGTTGMNAGESLKLGARITALRLPAALVVLFVTGVIPVLFLTSVAYFLIPLLVAVPGIVAVAFSRFALKATAAPMPDPNKPTDERMQEKRAH